MSQTPGTKTAVITGTTSFIGAHLVRAFAEAGYTVTATLTGPRDSYSGLRARRLATLPDSASFATLDIREGDAVAKLIERLRPDIWVHQAGYTTRYGLPDYDLAAGFAINVEPLWALFRHCAKTGTGVIVTGSASEYGIAESPNREEDICLPETPYALCKLTETLAARQLSLRYGVPTRVARIFNPIGALDDPNKVLALVAESLINNHPIDLSPCTQLRDFLAIEDLCTGYLALARDLPRVTFDLFNLSNGRGTVLKELLLSLAQTLGADPSLLRFGAISMRPGETPVSIGANDKAQEILGWKPKPIEEALNPRMFIQNA
ncbi:MAG: NAD(P)-dependent oxidoreductase [Rhodospirillales bacterium]